MSTPAASSSAFALTGMPSTRSITITSRWHQSQQTSGTTSRLPSAKLRRNWLALAASLTRSSSLAIVFSNSVTTSRGRSRVPLSKPRSTNAARTRSNATSLAITSRMPGRSTFTATSRPEGSTAKWTCATEALATGVVSRDLNISVCGLP